MIGKYKSYEKYKESGITWLGQMPEHWPPTFIKGVTKTYSEKGKPDAELLSVYRDYGVIKKSSRDDNHNKPGMDLSGYKVVYPNTLVLNKMKTWSGSLGVSNYFGIVSPAYITCNIDLEQVDTKYLNYLLRCKNYVFEYNRLSYGVRPSQWDMRYQDFKSIPIYLPTLDEQTAIAAFLDFKLAKINRFIRKKKQLIKLLNEQKAAIINQAVTKGLDPNAKMKPSGIEWLGDIPEHWEIRKLKYLGKIKSGDGITSTEIEESGEYEVYGGNGFIGYANKFNVEKENLVIGRVGAKCGNVHYTNERKFISDNALILSLNKGLDYKYYSLVLEVANLNSLNTSSAQPLITGTKVINYPIPIASKKEQLKIATYIEKETAKLNQTITTIEKEIALVEEYKTSLIAEAVTGKIDVRDYVIPEVEETESFNEIEDEFSMAAEDAEDYENTIDL